MPSGSRNTSTATARVVAIDGDAGFQMTQRALAVAVHEDLPVTVCVLDDGGLGMVRQQQELFFAGRHSQVTMPTSLPDPVRVADAYGLVGLRATAPAELGDVLAEAATITDRAVLVHVVVDPTAHVLPFVPAGSNDLVFETIKAWEAHTR